MNGDLNLEIITWFSEKDDGIQILKERIFFLLNKKNFTAVQVQMSDKNKFSLFHWSLFS